MQSFSFVSLILVQYVYMTHSLEFVRCKNHMFRPSLSLSLFPFSPVLSVRYLNLGGGCRREKHRKRAQQQAAKLFPEVYTRRDLGQESPGQETIVNSWWGSRRNAKTFRFGFFLRRAGKKAPKNAPLIKRDIF